MIVHTHNSLLSLSERLVIEHALSDLSHVTTGSTITRPAVEIINRYNCLIKVSMPILALGHIMYRAYIKSHFMSGNGIWRDTSRGGSACNRAILCVSHLHAK